MLGRWIDHSNSNVDTHHELNRVSKDKNTIKITLKNKMEVVEFVSSHCLIAAPVLYTFADSRLQYGFPFFERLLSYKCGRYGAAFILI